MAPGLRFGPEFARERGQEFEWAWTSGPCGSVLRPVIPAECWPHPSRRSLAASRADLARIAELVNDRGAIEVIVGLPLSLTGTAGHAAQAALEYARDLAA